jgi:hypothetical protein
MQKNKNNKIKYKYYRGKMANGSIKVGPTRQPPRTPVGGRDQGCQIFLGT